jgi:hypothetical protein
MRAVATGRKEFCSAAWIGWFLLLFVALACRPARHRDQSPSALPDFTLPEVRGGSFHLRGGHSTAVLVAFLQTVPDISDTPSRQQVAFLLSMNHQYRARGLMVVIVDSSALVTRQPPSHNQLVNASYDWHLDVPLLEDPGNLVSERSGVIEVPTLILVSPEGRVTQRWEGLTGPAILAQAIEKECGPPRD